MKIISLCDDAGRALTPAKIGNALALTFTFAMSVLLWPASVSAQTLPTVTSGTLLVHLKADAGVAVDGSGTNVTGWTDQVNSYSFPTFLGTATNGYPNLITNAQGVQFIRFATNSLLGDTQAPTFLELFPTANSGLTIFTAFSTTNNNVQQYLINQAVPTSSSLSQSLELGPNAGARGAGTFGLNRSGSATINALLNTTFAPVNTVSNNLLYVMSTLIKTNGYAPSNVEIYKNGVSQTLAVANGGGVPTTPGWLGAGQYVTGQGALFIGGRVNVANAGRPVDAYLKGNVGEIIIYQGALSLKDRAAIEAYLGNKYTVTIVPPPALLITKQPQSLAVTNGEPATFTIAAEALNGDAVSYQWQTNGIDIAGATNSSLMIASVGSANLAAYRCIVSGSSTNVISSAAQLRLITATMPAVTSGTLLVHLRADSEVVTTGSDVTTWFDQSPNHFQFDATSDPAAGAFFPTTAIGTTGNKVIHFDGASIVLNSVPVQLFTESNSPVTIFTAFSIHERSVQRYLLNAKVPRVGTAWNEMMVGVDAGNRGVGNYGVHRAQGAATFTAPNIVTNDQFYVMTMMVKSNGVAPDNILIYKNRVPQPVTGLPPTTLTIPDTGWLSAGNYPTGTYPLYIGTAADSSQPSAFSPVGPFAGDIGEIIVFQGQLSDFDRGQVEQYLTAKYGIGSALSILAGPQPLALASGDPANFSVAATAGNGANVTYQWQKNGVNIDNATNSTFPIPSVSAIDAANYRVVVAIPGTSISSASVSLRVLSPTVLPTVSSGSLFLHLRADAGIVTNATGLTVWNDQSTNGFVFNAISNPTNSQPSLAVGVSGNRVVRFNGANNNLLCSVPVELFPTTSSPLTLFTVAGVLDNSVQRYLVTLRVPRIGTSQAIIAANFSNCTGYLASLTSWFNELSLGVNAGNRAAGNYGIHRAAGDSTFAPANTCSNNQLYGMTTVIKSTGNAPTNIAIYQDGTLTSVTGFIEANAVRGPRDLGWLSAGDYPTGSSNSGGDYELRIGQTRDATLTTGLNTVGNCWWGDIGEVIVYRGELSDSDLVAVQSYIVQKYGVGSPRLQIAASAGNAIISYPATVGAYNLESTSSLAAPAIWTPVIPAPVQAGDKFSVTNAIGGEKYYRLRQVQ